ncbi:uncharacterized protein [Epargyreus clarus]|uniref:uncharacterized protein isoform X6 n=1 Tax=Epargyreus clarus TaxID=520877 RepID=UPI003C2DB5D5
MGPTTAATRPQLYALVNFMGEHPDLARGLLRGADARVRAKQLWEELCVTLNSMGGCCKTVEQWQRVWSDRKHLAKKNAVAARRAARDAGESSYMVSTLSHLELKIVSITGEGFGEHDIDIDTKAPFSPLKPSNDESDVEESEPNNTYQEVVYLYDSDSKSTKKEVAPVRPKKLETSTPVIQKEREREREKEKEKKERDKTDGIDRRKRRRMSMFVEEETPAKENGEGDEEIEKFGKYVVCLMKTIPKELCTQLQMDMINLIMTAKIKYMAKPMETSDSNAQAEFVVMNEGKVQHMQIADDGAEKTTETDANEQTYEEVVYLQDSDTKTLKEIRLKKLDGPDKKHESEHRKRRLMTTQDEKGVDDDEIEKFGKYVTCLMKPLPNELCTQLQMDIINTIMRGKIKFMSKPTPVPQTNVIIEKVGTDYQPSLVMTVANEHMPFLEANTVVATQA